MEDRTPSQEHDTDSIDGLVASTRLQAENIDQLVGGFKLMSKQLQERPTKKGVWKIVTVVATVIIMIVLTLSWLSYSSSHDGLEEIKSCTTPEGKCAVEAHQRSLNITGDVICNQEKVLYFQYYDNGYVPLDICSEFINLEIDRLEIPEVHPPKVEVDKNVPQYGYGIGVETLGSSIGE